MTIQESAVDRRKAIEEPPRNEPGPSAFRAASSPATAKVASAATVASKGAFVAAKAPTRQVSEHPSAVICGISGEPPSMRTALSPSVTKSVTPVTATTVSCVLAR